MSTEQSDFVDVHEASRLTGLSVPTLYRLSRLRKIRSFQVLSALRFSRADLQAIITERPAAEEEHDR